MSLAADERPEHSGVLDTEAAQLDFMSLQSIENGLQIHIHESTKALEEFFTSDQRGVTAECCRASCAALYRLYSPACAALE